MTLLEDAKKIIIRLQKQTLIPKMNLNKSSLKIHE